MNPQSSVMCMPGPPVSRQTTGFPAAMASITTAPPPSRKLGNRKTSWLSMFDSNSPRGMCGTKWTLESRLVSWIRDRSRGPSGPLPMMLNSASGCRSENSLNALMARLNPLTLMREPAESTRNGWLVLPVVGSEPRSSASAMSGALLWSPQTCHSTSGPPYTPGAHPGDERGELPPQAEQANQTTSANRLGISPHTPRDIDAHTAAFSGIISLRP